MTGIGPQAAFVHYLAARATYRSSALTITSVSVRPSSSALACARALTSGGMRIDVGGVWVSFMSRRPDALAAQAFADDAGGVVRAEDGAVDVGGGERLTSVYDDCGVLAFGVGGAGAFDADAGAAVGGGGWGAGGLVFRHVLKVHRVNTRVNTREVLECAR